MNSQKKIYDELFKEHPELKESNVDIPGVISLMQELNPDIVADQDYKNTLKQRLDTIAKYNPQKWNSIFWFLKYFIPVFSFWFAVFWFVYFSDEFKPESQKIDSQVQLRSVAPEGISESSPSEMMMLSDMADEQMLHKEPVAAQTSMKSKSLMTTRNIPTNNNLNTEPESTGMADDNISDEVLEEVMPRMFSMDSMMEDESVNDKNEQLESLEFSWMAIMSEEEIIEDIFADICWEYNGLIKVLEDNSRTCILENKNCYETDYIEKKCFESINVTK